VWGPSLLAVFISTRCVLLKIRWNVSLRYRSTDEKSPHGYA
jgi:hypothetical protein